MKGFIVVNYRGAERVINTSHIVEAYEYPLRTPNGEVTVTKIQLGSPLYSGDDYLDVPAPLEYIKRLITEATK